MTRNKENKENITPEKIKEINENITKKISQATRRRIIFKTEKKLFKKKQSLSQFEEPILILLRQNGHAEFYENATGGKFYYTHSDKGERFIILDQSFLTTFDYAGNTFKGYICHEDFPTPLPENPIVTTELVAIMYEKILNDMKKWKIEEEKAKALKIKSWALLIGVIGGIFLLWIILKPSGQGTIAQNITQNLTEVAKTNATIIKTVIG